MTDGVAPPAPWWRSPRIVTAAKAVFVVAVVAFGAWYVVSRWSQLRPALAAADPRWLVVAAVAAGLGQWAASLSSRAVLQVVGATVPVLAAARVFFISQLGKYLPGSVWPVVALAQMGRRYGLSTRAGAIAGLFSLAFSLLVGGGVGVVLVLGTAGSGAAGLWWLVLALPVLVALVQPGVVRRIVDLLLRITRRPPVELTLDRRTLSRVIGWQTASWLLLGLQCWALFVGVGGPRWSTLGAAVGGFALAYAAGTLFVPAPAGVGVREAVLALCLGAAVTGLTATSDIVIATLLMSRVLLAVLDFGQAGVVVLVARRFGPDAAATAGAGDGTPHPDPRTVR